MRAVAAVILICSLAGCGRPAERESRSAQTVVETPAPGLPPVLDAAAPTVAELERRGLVRTDEEPTGWSCGPDCTVDGFTAIYMGREKEGDRRFICPVADGEMDSWKCRAVETARG